MQNSVILQLKERKTNLGVTQQQKEVRQDYYKVPPDLEMYKCMYVFV